jgi:predicted RNase H-like nuclease (RuvC/YqgF family)
LDIPQHDPSDTYPDPIPEMETPHSPDDHNTLADLLSTSTAPAAGPSVQLVERMSALVRKLESEKAGFKDEIVRLSSQRDSSRDEVVTLMREVEGKRDESKRVEGLEKELEVLKGRYEASLEMLGEREEEVVELRGDVGELKRLYRELVERKVGGGEGK